MYNIEYYKGHYVVTDNKGNIFVHCDNYKEAQEERKELEESDGKE